MKYVGLTGGIGSGKSLVSEQFRDLNVPIIDADVIARELVSPGSPALNQLIKLFGHEIIKSDGQLDRQKVKQLVFSNQAAKNQLEAVLHPLIQKEIYHQAQSIHERYCLIVIPLLFENKENYQWLEKIIVVDLPEAIQVERTCQRDTMTQALAQKIISKQATRQARLAFADFIIDNSQDKANTKKQVEHIHHQLLEG